MNDLLEFVGLLLGGCLMAFLSATLAAAAIERIFCVASLLEAAHEACKQGRAPILRARLWLSNWNIFK